MSQVPSKEQLEMQPLINAMGREIETLKNKIKQLEQPLDVEGLLPNPVDITEAALIRYPIPEVNKDECYVNRQAPFVNGVKWVIDFIKSRLTEKEGGKQ